MKVLHLQRNLGKTICGVSLGVGYTRGKGVAKSFDAVEFVAPFLGKIAKHGGGFMGVLMVVETKERRTAI